MCCKAKQQSDHYGDDVSIELCSMNSAPDAKSGFWILALRIGIRQKRLVGWVALTIVALATATALILPDIYTSTTVLLPPPDTNSLGAQLMSQLGNAGGMAALGASAIGIKNPNDLQVALLKSRTVEEATVERFRLQEEYHSRSIASARRHWERETKIDSGLKDGLIRISVMDRDPRRAAELANGWVDEYRKFAATLAITEAARRRMFLGQELEQARTSLTQAEEQMAQTERRTGVITLQGQASAMIASAAMLRGQVAAKEVEIRSMRQFAGAANPDLQRAEQELSALQSQLSAMNVNTEQDGGDLVAPHGTLAQAGLDYERALREVKYRETVVELLSRMYEAAAVDEARHGPLIQIVDPAVAPDRVSSHYRFWIVLGGLFCSLPFSLLIAMAVEAVAVLRMRRKSNSSWAAVLEESLAGEEA